MRSTSVMTSVMCDVLLWLPGHFGTADYRTVSIEMTSSSVKVKRGSDLFIAIQRPSCLSDGNSPVSGGLCPVY